MSLYRALHIRGLFSRSHVECAHVTDITVTKKIVFFILENFTICTMKYDHAHYHFPLPTPSMSSRAYLPPNFMSSPFSSLPTKSISAVHPYVVVWLLNEAWETYQWPHPPKRMSFPLPAAFPWPTNPRHHLQNCHCLGLTVEWCYLLYMTHPSPLENHPSAGREPYSMIVGR